eukprot:2626908-Amphidinium_carterae.2
MCLRCRRSTASTGAKTKRVHGGYCEGRVNELLCNASGTQHSCSAEGGLRNLRLRTRQARPRRRNTSDTNECPECPHHVLLSETFFKLNCLHELKTATARRSHNKKKATHKNTAIGCFETAH